MLRVVTLNLWRDDYLKKERLELTVKAIKNASPTIVTLQEVTSATDLGYQTTAHYIAEKTGMRVIVCNNPSEEEIGTAILSTLPAGFSQKVKLTDQNGKAVYAELVHPKRNILIATAHLSWGSLSEGDRLEEARKLDSIISSKISLDSGKIRDNYIGIITGDFNSLPDSPTLNYLRGKLLLEGKNTLWVDSWEHKDVPGYTSSLTNKNAHITATGSGLNPLLRMPERRIDYILSYGYAYGRAGSFVESELFAHQPTNGLFPSDHFGVLATINL